MSKGIFVVMEQRYGKVQNVGLELVGEATRLKEDLKDGLELDMIGLKGSPTNVYQSFTKEVKGAGTILEGLSADEAVKAIMDKLEAKFII